ncbi:MAG: GNAT family N-acetyltransferase [Bacteroidales bacterium]|nr:GNAT family N-acetyltransferase [Bacteroidales bacterium]
MIEFLQHCEIDRERWDGCVRSSSAATIFAEYDLLTLSCPQWSALVEDNYAAVMPLPWREKAGVKYIYNPFFHSRLGVFSSLEVDTERLDAFVRSIPRSFALVELNLNESNPAPDLSSPVQISHQISLDSPYDTLYQGFSTNHKRNIKSARASGLHGCDSVAMPDIIRLFRENRGRDTRIKMRDADYALFVQLADYAAQRGLLEVLGARDDEGHLLAGAAFLADGSRRWFWFSGRDEQFADRKAMFFIMDEYFRKHAHQPVVLDFNGSKNPNVARFYAGFGGEKYTIPTLHVVRWKWAKGVFKLYKKIKK